MKNYSLYFQFVFLFLASCSSWELKNRCENTRWFDYAQNLSKKGQYLEEDDFVQQCKEVETIDATQLDLGFKLGREKLCSYDEIYKRGTLGEPVFFKFCDGLEMKKMLEMHRQGLILFCRKDNGYPYGKSGKQYQNVCNAQQEKEFLPTYFSGRKDFLTESIASTTEEIASLHNKYSNARQRESQTSIEYSRIPNLLACSTRMVYVETLKKDESKTVCEEPIYIRSQRERLYSDLQDARHEVNSLNKEQLIAETALKNLKAELHKIPSNY